ncbi:MAG: cation transporter [Telmatospirillum sp.]|nr:cation transporter [Telmatospirillum sp.]
MTAATTGDDHKHVNSSSSATSEAERRTLFAFAITALFMVVEAAGGYLSGSLALLADAAHMLADVFSLLLAWAAFRLGRLAPDPRRSYGYRRFEVIAALINGATVVLLSVGIVYEAVWRLIDPRPVDAWPMLVVAAIGLGANIVTWRVLGHSHSPGGGHVHGAHGHDHDHIHSQGYHHDDAPVDGLTADAGSAQNLNLHGAILHVLGDLLGSAAAIVAAVVILLTGWLPVDPILSIGISALIAFSGVRLMGSSGHILLEGSPAGFDADRLAARLKAEVPGLVGVHHLHAWSVTSGHPMLTLHAVVRRDVDRDEALARIKDVLEGDFGLAHSVVQIEGDICGDEGCS